MPARPARPLRVTEAGPTSLVGAEVLQALVDVALTAPLAPPGVEPRVPNKTKRRAPAEASRYCFLEVGVYQGGSAWWLAKAAKMQRRRLYLYDTFRGIPNASPKHGDHHNVGDFADTDFDDVAFRFRHQEHVRIIQGEFPGICDEWPRRAAPKELIAFAHLDCDQYESYRSSLRYLAPRMAPGGVIWMDDLCLPGARQAVREWLTENGNQGYYSLEEVPCGKHIIRF